MIFLLQSQLPPVLLFFPFSTWSLVVSVFLLLTILSDLGCMEIHTFYFCSVLPRVFWVFFFAL